MIRGIERREIFRDDRDRRELVRRLSRLGPEMGYRCYAWALMPNHIHLVVRSGEARVSRLMARLGTGYARYFNERHDRVGHLFQNRFRSRLVLDDRDLLGVVLYVCRNPLDGALVADSARLECFPWCSVGALVGRRAPHGFESVDETLALFDGDADRARSKLREHLGSPALADEGSRDEARDRVAPAAVPRAHGSRLASPVQTIREACTRCGVTETELRSRGRDPRLARARSVVARRLVRELGLSGAQVARELGLTRSAVSKLLSRGE
jgi:REP element-mobilizing transposase RayT